MARADAAERRSGRNTGRVSLLYDPRVRGIASQILVAVGLVLLIGWFVHNTSTNLQRANIASGFGFLETRAGFEISQHLVPYSPESSYGRAFIVGLLNTLLVAAIGIVVATILGFLVGVARLSRNWIVSRIAAVFVETLRNIPVLLQLLFWYRAVLSVLPGPRQAVSLPLGSSLSNRGLMLPKPVAGEGFGPVLAVFGIAVVVAIVIAIWARRRRMATGQPFPTGWTGLAIIVGATAVAFLATGAPLSFEVPELKGFNFIGGFHILPEFLALLLGLSLYTSTYIAEIVRAGILAVPPGQSEAAYALGFRPGLALRLVIVPQPLRVIIPPLTNQYL
nr:ABC transporter permease subunit [Bauldia sp.]